MKEYFLLMRKLRSREVSEKVESGVGKPTYDTRGSADSDPACLLNEGGPAPQSK